MLDLFRNFYASIIGKVITIVVAVLFVVGFSFLPYIVGSGGVPSQDAASVNGKKISINALDRYYGRLENEYERLYGNKLTKKEIEMLNLKGAALSSLIADKVLELKAGVFGIHVSEGFIARDIASYGAFQENGKFSTRLFDKVLLANHMTPAGFENSLRSRIIRSYIKNIIEESFSITQRQFTDNFSINNKSVSFESAVFKSKKDADSFLNDSILNGKTFNESVKKFQGVLKSVPLYSEINLIKSSYFKNYGLNGSMVPVIFSSPAGSVIAKVFHVKSGFMVIKVKRVYFPRYLSPKNKNKGAMLTQRQSFGLQKEQEFLYSYVDYLEHKSNVKINKKALASLGS